MSFPYENLDVYYGDLHNHCNIGYAHGSIEDAYRNARLQLDFVCVTVHAHWHDIPEGEPRLASLVDYHKKGFARTAEQWDRVKEMVAAHHRDDEFVTFLGFEWHSNRYGDHNVYFKGTEGAVIRASDMAEMRQRLRDYADRGIDTMLIPHHIGYKAGYRGINWEAFDPEFISVVEVMSMHGASESPTTGYPYLHTMGPRDWQSTLQYGLARGHIVGVVGSTDHHSAHPGSYGHGKVGVWAAALTRDGVWDALRNRRTYALTGDRIRLAFSLNGQPMGAIAPAASTRNISVAVEGGDALDYVEVLHNNRVVHRWNPDFETQPDPFEQPLKVYLEVGWGERNENVDWNVALRIEDGELRDVEPRFRGHEVVAPQSNDEEKYAFSDWQWVGPNAVAFTTRTWGNPTTTTASTQGMCFEVDANPQTHFVGTINGQAVDIAITDLLAGPRANYLGGFVSAAYYFHQAVPRSAYRAEFQRTLYGNSQQRDWYYVRVRQKNGHWAWGSPIWVRQAAGNSPSGAGGV